MKNSFYLAFKILKNTFKLGWFAKKSSYNLFSFLTHLSLKTFDSLIKIQIDGNGKTRRKGLINNFSILR